MCGIPEVIGPIGQQAAGFRLEPYFALGGVRVGAMLGNLCYSKPRLRHDCNLRFL